MRRRFVLAPVILVTGCNVFLALDSVEPTDSPNSVSNQPNNEQPQICDSSCTCTDDCEVDCADCDIACLSGATCDGLLGDDSTADCARNANCEMGCAEGDCAFSCTDRDSDCFVDCSDDARCLLDCGTNRNRPRVDDCVFVNCEAPMDCGDGVFACNRDCP